MNLPDLVAICVSSPGQAESIKQAVVRRQTAGIYPREMTFAVVHDPPHGRVGSGGGTIHALNRLRELYGDVVDDWSILLIHAGGESRRLPAWAPEGKLFAPVPVASSTVHPPILLDIQLGLYVRYPWRTGELVVASGDVYLDFDVASIRRDRGEVCGFSVPASFEESSRHGVFVFDDLRRNVVGYLQKAPVDRLRGDASLPGGESCALDIGIVAFDRTGRGRLSALNEHFGARIARGEVYIDLYVEILTGALSGIDDPTYESLIADRSRLTPEDRSIVRDVMRDASLQGVLGRKSTFLHYGSVGEVPETAFHLAGSRDILPFYDVAAAADLTHELLPERDGSSILIDCDNVTVDTGIATERPSVIDASTDIALSPSGGNLVTAVGHAVFPIALPEGFCLDGRGDETEYVAVYHRDDTFKPSDGIPVVCGTPLDRWLADRNLPPDTVAVHGDASIWDLQLWPALPKYTSDSDKTRRGACIAAFWDASFADDAWRGWFLSSPRRTLSDLNATSDLTRRETRRRTHRAATIRRSVLSGSGWQSLPAIDARTVFSHTDLPTLTRAIETEPDELIRVYRGEVVQAVENSVEGLGGEPSSSSREPSIEIRYLSSLTSPPLLRRAVKPDQIVWARSPVRMDLGGGWTDTPPYTLREGGRVTNVAIDINGQPPVQVFCRPITQPEVRFRSIDLGEGEVVRTFGDLERYNDPTVPFALPRAALVILGFTRENHPRHSLSDVLTDLGGGLEVTLLAAVPQGSGLGTSSILAATLLAALERFFGVFDETHIDTGELYRQVLQMEQMLTTGGGWQDQVGGVAGGIKYSVSTPGMRPDLQVYRLDPHLFLDPAATTRYTLFYTGATRLAKNILQEVVDGFNSMSPAYIFTVRRIGYLADAAREAFALRDIDRLAWVIDESWKQNKLIHPSTSNEEIDEMLSMVRGYYTSQKLLGAGGGGFAFFISRDAYWAERLREALVIASTAAGNKRARVVDMSLNQSGLQVTVS